MENSFTHNLVNMGGGIMSPGPDSTLCVAFAAAVAEFCGPPPAPNRNGRFNDMMYNHLHSTHPPEGMMLAEQMEREVAMLADRTSTRSLRQMYKQAKKQGNPDRIRRYGQALRGDNVLRSRLGRGDISFNEYRRLSNNNLAQSGLGARQFRYPDGMLNGYPVEFKSPVDRWGTNVSNKSGGDQMTDYQKIRKDGQVIEVSCESCNHPCANPGFPC